jgi:hypothetical protein
VRARTSGGAFAPFDLLSSLTEAPLADAGALVATTMGAASYRTADAAGTSTALRTTRFPVMQLAGPLSRRLVVSAGFSTYLDKSYDVVTQDTVMLRGVPEPLTDEIASDGGVADLRLAAASRLAARVAIGAAIHLLSGSTRASASRRFLDSTTYTAVQQVQEIRYDGLGYSGSVLLDPAPGLRLAGFGRIDLHLNTRIEDQLITTTELPRSVGGAVLWQPSPALRAAAGVTWRSWSRTGPGSFNTLGWSVGGELGAGQSPLRVGVRGGQFPFGPGAQAPTEWAVAVGTGRSFAAGRGVVDLGLERLERKGAGLTERVWTVLLGLAVRP